MAVIPVNVEYMESWLCHIGGKFYIPKVAVWNFFLCVCVCFVLCVAIFKVDTGHLCPTVCAKKRFDFKNVLLGLVKSYEIHEDILLIGIV